MPHVLYRRTAGFVGAVILALFRGSGLIVLNFFCRYQQKTPKLGWQQIHRHFLSNVVLRGRICSRCNVMVLPCPSSILECCCFLNSLCCFSVRSLCPYPFPSAERVLLPLYFNKVLMYLCHFVVIPVVAGLLMVVRLQPAHLRIKE